MKNFIENFGIAAAKHANKTAIVDFNGSRSTTYAELDLLRRRCILTE